jgi:hypothetical protein
MKDMSSSPNQRAALTNTCLIHVEMIAFFNNVTLIPLSLNFKSSVIASSDGKAEAGRMS